MLTHSPNAACARRGTPRHSRPGTPRHPILSHTVALIALLAACAAPEPPDPGIAVDSAGVRVVTSDPTASGATCTVSEEPLLVIGEDEQDERQWFSAIQGVGRLSDGSIVVADGSSAEVRVYDGSGRHLRSMGRRGEGPGEFDDPFQLWVAAGDTIWVGDSSAPWRYNLFAAQGDFVRQVNLTPVFPNFSVQGGVLDNGYSVNSRSRRARRENFGSPDTLFVQVHDPAGQLAGTLARLPDRTSGAVREVPDFFIFPLFQSFALADAAGSTIVLGHGAETEVRVLDDKFNLRTIVRWHEPGREVTGADVSAWREDYIARRNQSASAEWSRFDDARTSDDRPVADLFPAISDLIASRDGRIWVRQYDRPREDRAWLGFSPAGDFLCHLAPLPGGVTEFGADYVLLQGETDMGIPTVRLYRLDVPEQSVDSAIDSTGGPREVPRLPGS